MDRMSRPVTGLILTGILAFAPVTRAAEQQKPQAQTDRAQEEEGGRYFGDAPTKVLRAYRKEVPPQTDPANPQQKSQAEATRDFMRNHSASEFFSGGPPMPTNDQKVGIDPPKQ